MLIETNTSVYKILVSDGGKGFVVEKLAVKAGKISSVRPGEVYWGSEVTFTPHGLILRDGARVVLTTSPLLNL
jgi:hypothetical protein